MGRKKKVLPPPKDKKQEAIEKALKERETRLKEEPWLVSMENEEER